MTDLIHAAKEGDLAAVTTLLSQDAAINAKTHQNFVKPSDQFKDCINGRLFTVKYSKRLGIL